MFAMDRFSALLLRVPGNLDQVTSAPASARQQDTALLECLAQGGESICRSVNVALGRVRRRVVWLVKGAEVPSREDMRRRERGRRFYPVEQENLVLG